LNKNSPEKIYFINQEALISEKSCNVSNKNEISQKCISVLNPVHEVERKLSSYIFLDEIT